MGEGVSGGTGSGAAEVNQGSTQGLKGYLRVGRAAVCRSAEGLHCHLTQDALDDLRRGLYQFVMHEIPSGLFYAIGMLIGGPNGHIISGDQRHTGFSRDVC